MRITSQRTDSNGNVTFLAFEDGSWNRYEYDHLNMLTYFENSQGYWYRRNVDTYGRETSYENSEGFWVNCKYDPHGVLLYEYDSTGHSYESDEFLSSLENN